MKIDIKKLMTSFCLYGKITEKHADEIKNILMNLEKELNNKIMQQEEKRFSANFNKGKQRVLKEMETLIDYSCITR